MKSKKILAFGMSMACVSAFGLDMDTKEVQLDTVHTTAVKDTSTYYSKDVLEHKGTMNVISKDTLQKGAVRTLDEALQRIPGVQIRDYSGTGILPKISVRGFGSQGNGHSNTALILLDGIPVYGAPYSNIELALFPITSSMVDHISLEKGAAALWAGPNSFGGVINVFSKPIPKEWETEISSKVTFWGSSGKAEQFYRTKNDARRHALNQSHDLGNNVLYDTFFRTGGHVNDKFAVQASMNIIKGQGFRYDTPQNIQNYRLDATYDINEQNKIKTYYQYYYFDSTTAGALAIDDYKFNRYQNTRPFERANGPAKRFGLVYDNYFGSDALNGNFNLTYYFHDQTRNLTIDENYRTAKASVHIPQSLGGTTTTTNGQNSNPFEIIDNPRRFVVNGVRPTLKLNYGEKESFNGKFLVGLNYESEDIYQRGIKTTYSTGSQNVTSDNTYYNQFLAFFINNEFNIGNFSITPGFRYDYMNYDKRDRKKATKTVRNFNEFSGGVNLGYTFNKQFLIFANYNRSILPPQLGNVVEGNVNFTQHANVAEAGFKYFLGKELVINATYFIVFVDNQTLTINSVRTQAGATRSQGVELEAFYSPRFLDGLTIHLGYNFTDARILHGTNANNFLPYVSPHQIIADASYSFGKTTIAYSSYFYSSSFSDLGNTRAESADGSKGLMPAYYVGNIQVSRELYDNEKHRIIGSLSVNNIFNDEYYFRGIGTSPTGRQPAPGRSVSAQVRYIF